MVRLRLKIPQAPQDETRISFKQFLQQYFNSFLSELSVILMDFRAVQEHANRNKIIAFVDERQKDLSLLCLLARSLSVQETFHHKMKKKRRYEEGISQLVDVAEFVAGMYESMKSSFVPRCDFRLALQTILDAKKLLISSTTNQETKEMADVAAVSSLEGCSVRKVENEQNLIDINFSEITRLMMIFLMRENIKDCSVENGVLMIRSDWFVFHLVLCGDYFSPEWRILRVEGPFMTEDLEKQIVMLLRPNISNIQEFCSFYRQRRLAVDLFEALEESHGFFKNFSGRLRDAYITAKLANGTFLTTVSYRGEEHVFENKSVEDVKNVLENKKTQEESMIDRIALRGVVNFWEDELGENYSHIVGKLFVAFFRDRLECVIGMYPNGRKIQVKKVGLDVVDCRIVGKPINEAGSLSEDRAKAALFHKTFFTLVDSFIERNTVFFPALYECLPFLSHFLLDGALSVDNGVNVIVRKNRSDMSLKVAPAIDSTDKADHQRSSVWEGAFSVLSFSLACIENALPPNFVILKALTGRSLTLSHHGITIVMGDHVETSIDRLTEDCARFNHFEALSYINSFGKFYKTGLYPMALAYNTVAVDLFSISSEFLIVEAREGHSYSFSGDNTLKLTKLPSEVPFTDENFITVLYRAHLVSQFAAMERRLQLQRLPDGKSLRVPGSDGVFYLTPEGIVYRSQSDYNTPEINRILACEKNVVVKVKKMLERSPKDVKIT